MYVHMLATRTARKARFPAGEIANTKPVGETISVDLAGLAGGVPLSLRALPLSLRRLPLSLRRLPLSLR